MPDFTRRKLIKVGGTAGIVGLAGCGGGDGGDGGDGADGSDGGTATPTATPGDDPTPTDSNGTPTGDGGTTTTGDGGSIQSRTINLGTLLPVSGEFGSIGQTMEDAARLAFQRVGEESEPLSVDITYGDSQSQPTGAINGANNLANAGVPAVVGASTTSNYLQTAQQVFIPGGIVMCGPGPTAVAITHLEDDDLCFRVSPSDAFQGRVMAQYAANTLEVSSAATLSINDAYGEGLSREFSSAFEEMGGTIQSQVSYESGQASYTSRISNAVEGDPGMLAFIAKGGSSSIQILKDYYADFDPELPMLTVDGMNTARIPNEVGRPLDNITGTAPQASGPAQDAFNSLYQEQYDRTPGPFNAATFDASAVLLMANAMAGENAGSAIKNQMRPVANSSDGATTVTIENLVEGVEAAAAGQAVNYQGAASPVQFDENGDLVAATYGIWEYAPDTESGFEVVETIEVRG